MVNIADLKNYILEEQQIEPILEELGCHHISHKAGYYQCANPDGDNRTALCIYENENLTAVDYTRDIANGKTSYDLISVVQFFLELSFPKAIIAIDFDGTLCENNYPDIGEPNWNVIYQAIQEQKHGAGLILWTCREGKLLYDAMEACFDWGLQFDAINDSLPEWNEHFDTSPRKIGADEYWDDKAKVVKNGELIDNADA